MPNGCTRSDPNTKLTKNKARAKEPLAQQILAVSAQQLLFRDTILVSQLIKLMLLSKEKKKQVMNLGWNNVVFNFNAIPFHALSVVRAALDISYHKD